MIKILKLVLLLFFISSLFVSNITSLNADFFSDTAEKIEYCNGDKGCGLKEGVEIARGIDGVKTDGTAKDQIQKIVLYLLSFTTFIAVIYIIYAGFRILTSSGEDEVIKSQKKTIGYVVLGIVVIWFAWTIAIFAVSIGAGGTKINLN